MEKLAVIKILRTIFRKYIVFLVPALSYLSDKSIAFRIDTVVHTSNGFHLKHTMKTGFLIEKLRQWKQSNYKSRKTLIFSNHYSRWVNINHVTVLPFLFWNNMFAVEWSSHKPMSITELRFTLCTKMSLWEKRQMNGRSVSFLFLYATIYRFHV